MLTSGLLLLLTLTVLTVHGVYPDQNDSYIDYEDYTDAPEVKFDVEDWLLHLMEETHVCEPNPCFHGGSCVKNITVDDFECLCPQGYSGKRCHRVKNICELVRCGHGDCILNLKTHPYFKCKCRPPFIGPSCNQLPASVCEPNPCQNGGSCTHGKGRMRCACPEGFTGRFCATAPTDCYSGRGESYRGMVSSTVEGEDCLDWHSNLVMMHMGDPFIMYPNSTALEGNNHCRNPDGDEMPWCYYRKNKTVEWDYCRVKKCSEDPVDPPATVAPEVPPSQFAQCGKVEPGRIHMGSKALPGALPWQVSLQVRPPDSDDPFEHICGGTLISSCWVITAAHCLLPDYEMQVVVGGLNILKEESIEQIIPVVRGIVHENYKGTFQGLYNDVALLELAATDGSSCANETAYVKSACLPDLTFPPGTECVISGWGATKTQSISSQLLKADVLLISDEKCNGPHVYGTRLDGSMFCAGYLRGGIDSCKGDSGGPLVCKHNSTHYLTGVVSWGDDCGTNNKPGVYANVTMFIDWINDKTT